MILVISVGIIWIVSSLKPAREISFGLIPIMKVTILSGLTKEPLEITVKKRVLSVFEIKVGTPLEVIVEMM